MRCSTRRTFGMLAGLLMAAAAFAAPAAAAATSPAIPFTDPSTVGSIGFCNQAGQQITSGNITTAPFVWRAVSTQAAAAPYNAPGRTATLYAYQPLQVLAPGDWSGAQLTAATRYQNVSHPTAVATAGDGSLANFIGQFSPQWDGLLQVRMFLDAPNRQVDSLTYPSTTIKVTGDSWTVVSPVATVSCESGPAESIESILLPHSSTSAATPATQGTAPAPASSLAASATTAPSSSSSGHGLLAIILVVVLVLAIAGYVAVSRRDRPTTGRG